MGQSYVIKPDGSKRVVWPASTNEPKGKFLLTELTTFVGGFIELIPIAPDKLADLRHQGIHHVYADEQGHLKQLKPNAAASAAVGVGLIGNVLFVTAREDQ